MSVDERVELFIAMFIGLVNLILIVKILTIIN